MSDGLHNGSMCKPEIRQAIVNGLASGEPKTKLATLLSVSIHTVHAIEKDEWQELAKRKARICAQAERAATKAFELINQRLDEDGTPDETGKPRRVSLPVLVPVAGMCTDKVQLLRGDPTAIIEVQHDIGPNLHQRLLDLYNSTHGSVPVPKPVQATVLEPAPALVPRQVESTSGEQAHEKV